MLIKTLLEAKICSVNVNILNYL